VENDSRRLLMQAVISYEKVGELLLDYKESRRVRISVHLFPLEY
jgi:hypothetical protein